jgi:hypothetical protein
MDGKLMILWATIPDLESICVSVEVAGRPIVHWERAAVNLLV